MTNNIVDLATFKKAKIVIADLTRIIAFYDLALAGLSNHYKYSPVAETLAKLKTDRQQLKIYLRNCQAFVDNKGVK